MPRTRYHLTEHALLDTIPLRIGRVLTSPKVYLEYVEEDPEGTANQTHSQRQSGRKHITADLWTESEAGEHLGRWRFVTGPTGEGRTDPPILTVLPLDRAQARTASNLTDYLANERKSGNSPWLTQEYVATVLRERVLSGELSNQAELGAFLREQVVGELREKADTLEVQRDGLRDKLERAKSGLTTLAQEKIEATARAERAEENERTALERLEAALRGQANNPPGVPPLDSVDKSELRLPATAVTEPWRSRTKNSQYVNVGVDAFIEDVNREGNRIHLRFIDSKGNSREIHDFGVINGFVSKVFDYLRSRQGQRAVFLVTYKPGDNTMLAADTMLLDTYRHLWR
jgi:hypothetical protein